MDLLFDTLPHTALFVVGLVVAAVVHEGGHAVAGQLAGVQPRVVNIGVGRPLLRFRLGRTWLVVRIGLLAAGWCAFEPSDRRWRLAALVAGGPLANLLALLVLYEASRRMPSAYDVLEPFGFAEAFGAAATLFPMRQTLNGRRVPSDGLRLYQLVVLGRTADLGAIHAKLLKTVQPEDAPPHPFTPRTGDILYQVLRQDRWREAWACRDAVAIYRCLLEAPDLTKDERAFLLCDLVVQHLLLGYPDVAADELDAWSKQAAALTDAPRARVARGAVLVATGNLADGRSRLLGAVAAMTDRGETLSATAVLANAMIGSASVDLPGCGVDWFDLARAIAAKLAAGRSIARAVTRIEASVLAEEVRPMSHGVRFKRWLSGDDLP